MKAPFSSKADFAPYPCSMKSSTDTQLSLPEQERLLQSQRHPSTKITTTSHSNFSALMLPAPGDVDRFQFFLGKPGRTPSPASLSTRLCAAARLKGAASSTSGRNCWRNVLLDTTGFPPVSLAQELPPQLHIQMGSGCLPCPAAVLAIWTGASVLSAREKPAWTHTHTPPKGEGLSA